MVVPLRWFVLVLALSPLAVMAQSAPPSGRHGDGHAQNHDWYKDLRQPDIGSRCCNGTVDGKQGDCRPAPSFMGEDGLYRAWDSPELASSATMILSSRIPSYRIRPEKYPLRQSTDRGESHFPDNLVTAAAGNQLSRRCAAGQFGNEPAKGLRGNRLLENGVDPGRDRLAPRLRKHVRGDRENGGGRDLPAFSSARIA